MLDQVGRERRQPLIMIVREARLDHDAAALDKAGLPQALT
jgi:hypothetical protein